MTDRADYWDAFVSKKFHQRYRVGFVDINIFYATLKDRVMWARDGDGINNNNYDNSPTEIVRHFFSRKSASTICLLVSLS